MGCFGSRKASSEEESILQACEQILTFHRHSVTTLYETFSVSARGDSINANALHDAAKSLSLPLRSSDHPGLIEKFYQGLRKDNDGVSLRALCLSAVLLTESQPMEKAGILFQMYDKEYTLVLSKEIVTELVQDLILTALSLPIPLLPPLTDPKISLYLSSLYPFTAPFLTSTVKSVLGDAPAITREKCLVACSQDPAGLCLQSSSLRTALYEIKRLQKMQGLTTPRAEQLVV